MLIEGKGFHELKKLYALYGKPEYVICPDLTHFKHNYNYVTRAIMYSWFNRHLKLGHPEPVIEQDFKLLSKEEHAVWNKHHPSPEGGDAYERRLMAQLDERDHRLLENLEEKKKAETMIKAWQTIVGRSMEDALEHNYQIEGNKLTNQSMKEEIELQIPENLPSAPKIVVLLGASAKKSMDQAVKPVLFRQNQDGPTEKVSNSREFAGYTHGYNHSRLARQIHDLLSVIAFLKSQTDQPIEIHAGQGFEAQAIVASYLAGNLINRVIVESSNFRFSQITNYHAPRFLPGAIKYGDLDFLIQTLGKKLKRS